MVCVDTNWHEPPIACFGIPQLDGVYMIDEVFLFADGRGTGIALREIVLPRSVLDGSYIAYWNYCHFRPAIDFQSLCDVKREERV